MNLLRLQTPGLADFAGLEGLRNEIDRLFGAPLSELARTPHFLNGLAPALDIYEDKDNFVARVELPGMKKDDIDVSLNDGVLSISGERKSEQKLENAQPHRTERFFGRFQRTINLPTPVAADKVSGQYKDGVLTVTLPKAEEAKPKKIDVQAN